MEKIKNLVPVAHDNRKSDLIEWVENLESNCKELMGG